MLCRFTFGPYLSGYCLFMFYVGLYVFSFYLLSNVHYLLFFSCFYFYLCYISPTAMLQYYWGLMMATISKIDEVTKLERDLVVDALKLKLASIGRAGKAATNPAIRDALMAEGVLVEALIARFR